MSDIVVGIDLGTTNSLVGAVINGHLKLFSDAEGRELLPSAVAMDESGKLVVGRAARNRRLLDPTGTALSVKRKMGTDVNVRVGKRELSPQEVSALVLGGLLDWVQTATGQRPKRAVITVPAYFGEAQRQATRDAGEIAGLKVERLVNEPTAAALTYQTGSEERVLVYDFGGGTFDVSVLERDQGFLEVKASRGDTQLGGDDVDQALVRLILDRVSVSGSRGAIEKDPRAMVRLLDAAERAKMALSTRDDVEVIEPYITGQGASGIHVECRLTREDLDQASEPFVARTLTEVERALGDARIKGKHLDRVLLVGGSSRLPLVAERVSELLDQPAYAEMDADRAVGLGASILAGRATGEDVAEVLVDIAPHSISIGVHDSAMPMFALPDFDELMAAKLIKKDTAVPVERKETFYTTVDDQTSIRAPITQGEGSRCGDNIPLGEIEVLDLPPSPAGSAVDVRVRLDLSGILHVSATHRASERTQTVIISHSPYRLSEQRREQSRREMEAIRAHEPGAVEESLGPDEAELRLAQAMVARAERAIEKAEPGEPSQAAQEALGALLKAIENRGPSLEAELDALSDALLEL
ncbi:MAG: Hsp70 family protein [Deltaproteobacteria bacterium]|nr:Hsp70 family protein [Deltaproteobacteria bacterium]